MHGAAGRADSTILVLTGVSLRHCRGQRTWLDRRDIPSCLWTRRQVWHESERVGVRHRVLFCLCMEDGSCRPSGVIAPGMLGRHFSMPLCRYLVEC